MKPYHPANLKHLPYAPWRVIVLAWAGKLLGVQLHVHGIPFGAPYRPEHRPGDNSARPIRVDRAGNAILPERKVILRGKGA